MEDERPERQTTTAHKQMGSCRLGHVQVLYEPSMTVKRYPGGNLRRNGWLLHALIAGSWSS